MIASSPSPTRPISCPANRFRRLTEPLCWSGDLSFLVESVSDENGFPHGRGSVERTPIGQIAASGQWQWWLALYCRLWAQILSGCSQTGAFQRKSLAAETDAFLFAPWKVLYSKLFSGLCKGQPAKCIVWPHELGERWRKWHQQF